MFDSLMNKAEKYLKPQLEKYMKGEPAHDANVSLLQLLVAVADIDDNITKEEEQMLKDYAFDKSIGKEDWEEIMEFTTMKASKGEKQAHLEAMIKEVQEKGQNEAFREELEKIVRADNMIDDEERELISKLTDQSADPKSLMGALGIFSKKLGVNLNSEKTSRLFGALDMFPMNPAASILKKEVAYIENPEVEGAKMGVIMALLKCDSSVSEDELGSMKRYMEARLKVNPEEAQKVASELKQIPEKSLEISHLCRTLVENLNEDDRKKFLGDLDKLIASDQKREASENKYFGLIKKYLHIV